MKDKIQKQNIEMNSINKTRDSNIELLRIIAMILIIIHHMVYHTKIYLCGGENHFISLIMLTGGKIGVIIYILIMGYYSRESKFNIKRPINIVIFFNFFIILSPLSILT